MRLDIPSTLDTLDGNRLVTVCFPSSVQGIQGKQGKNGSLANAATASLRRLKKVFAKIRWIPWIPRKPLYWLVKTVQGSNAVQGSTLAKAGVAATRHLRRHRPK